MSFERGFRAAGAAALAISAAAFVIGLVALYLAEGPASPDLNIYLSSASGQSDLLVMVTALTAAVVLFLFGLLVALTDLAGDSRTEAIVAGGLAVAAVPLFVGFLALHYALVGTLREGIDATSQPFRVQFLQAHAVGDWSGWTGIVLFAGSLLVYGLAVVRERRSPTIGWVAIAVAATGLVLVPTGLGFAFTLILPVWELAAAVGLLRTPPRGAAPPCVFR